MVSLVPPGPDLAIIYKYFVRSRMEYGCASYGASSSGGLEKFDVVQKRAEKLCGFTFQPLKARREASCFGLLCKMLDGVGVQPLLDMCPQFQLEDCSSGVVGGIGINSSSTRSCNLQVTNMVASSGMALPFGLLRGLLLLKLITFLTSFRLNSRLRVWN